ncbi:MAG: hypothetical protein COW01_14945 [Bdellovibrionales bacterium CG12_big_fil_rev_8_21_14_0_65_38_15]|nr:MAG: hypothetical protein COW79_09795 [Bdellovibrionales bacterium CG22_combo_CG10-13_8_21_14_all_38_13]PIQ52734.1 MAG: hypothetical protein COW01_14945 [Bdellovibrionales bacterium CG12_big_fil_rev_8_21_14_0_65_38_15]PIR31422.1 MAG: hypothetical protein COV38_00455 [Bdellovibrionales bacterium CG11_big_fil_rev_8_21_14_0_20_38_13]
MNYLKEIHLLLSVFISFFTTSIHATEALKPSFENEVYYYSKHYVLHSVYHKEMNGIQVYTWEPMSFYSDKELKTKVAEITDEGFFYKGSIVAELRNLEKISASVVLKNQTKLAYRMLNVFNYSWKGNKKCKLQTDYNYDLAGLYFYKHSACPEASAALLYFLHWSISPFAAEIVSQKKEMHPLFGIHYIFINEIDGNIAMIDHPTWGKIYFDISKISYVRILQPLETYLKDNKIGQKLLSEIKTLSTNPWSKIKGQQKYSGDEYLGIDLDNAVLQQEDDSTLCFYSYSTKKHDQAYWCYNADINKFFLSYRGGVPWARIENIQNDILILKKELKTK